MIKREQWNTEGVSVRIDGMPIFWTRIPKSREVVIPKHVIDAWSLSGSIVVIHAPADTHVMVETWKNDK